MNGETSEIIFKIIVIALSVIGFLSCTSIISDFIFRHKSNLYIKGNTHLILDVDEIGEKLEYYVRKIESDIAERYIYISRIILYSKTLNKSNKKDTGEIFKICKILAENYNNIIFLNDSIIENENDILSLMSKSVDIDRAKK